MALTTLGRTPEQLDVILHAHTGTLQDTPYPILLLALAVRERSAVLTLHRHPLQKEIVFDAGAPVDCRSNIATETLDRFLVASGKLSEEDRGRAVATASSRGLPLETVLIEQKLVAPAELDRTLQQSFGRKLLEPFSWKSGTFEIFVDEVPPAGASTMRVNVPQLILTGILKVEPQESVDDAIAAAGDGFLSIAPEPLFDLDDIRLSEDQQNVLQMARDGMRLSEAAAATGIDREDFDRIVYALLLLGALAVSETPRSDAPMFELDHPFAAAEPPPPPVATPAPVATPPGPRAATRAEVLDAHDSLRGKDAFALLGVAETDGAPQFNRAFLRIAETFLPSRFEEPLRDKAQDILLAAARAYAELVDPTRRDALLAARRLERRPPRPAAARPPVAPPPPPPKPEPWKPMNAAAMIDPEQFYRSGRALADAGKFREALSSFEMAAECDAQNGTYAAEAAWCRFQLQVSSATTTMKMLKNAIRIDPRSGIAHLYAGKVATAMGERSAAEAHLNRAAMLMPKDLRVVEALRSLR